MEGSMYDITEGIKEIKSRLDVLKKDNIIIGVAGGSGSGKGHVCFLLMDMLDVKDVKILAMDDYYRGIDLIPDQNFDCPEALDLDLLNRHLELLHKGKSIDKPKYDFKTHSRIGDEKYSPRRVILVEGLFALHEKIIKDFDIKIYIQASEKTRFQRRLERDIVERHRTEECVTKQWNDSVSPMHYLHVKPQKKMADIVIVND